MIHQHLQDAESLVDGVTVDVVQEQSLSVAGSLM